MQTLSKLDERRAQLREQLAQLLGAKRRVLAQLTGEIVAPATALHSFQTKERENKVMQLVAERLDKEQIASLAVYFASLTSD